MAQSIGKLVEYVEHGKFICSLVLEDINNKLRLINQNGREVKLARARLVHQSAMSYPINLAKEDIQRQLQDVDRSRQQLMAKVDLAEIWQLASEEDDSRFEPRFLAELSFGGEADDDHVAAFLRSVFIDRLFFKYREGKVIVHPPETVEQLRHRLEQDKAQEELFSQGAEALKAILEDKGSDWPGLDDALEMVGEYYVHGNDFADSETAQKLLKRAGLTGNHDVFNIMVKAGKWDKNENIPLMRYAVPTEFSAEAMAQAEAIGQPEAAALLAERRKDYRDLPLLTIDGPTTKDFDDALHIEKKGDNFLVGIHIADVAAYVAPDTPLFAEAKSRCTSIYFHDGQVPMLPRCLSEDICSLICGKARAAVSYMVLLSPAGEVLDCDVNASVVEVKRRITYTEADALAATDDEIRQLAELSCKIKARRINDGALLIPIPDVNVNIADNDEISIEINDVDTLARSMVAEFMVLANNLAAQFITDREAPGLFRSQGPPNKRLEEGYVKDLLVNYRQRRFLKPAKLMTRAKPHSCVGVMQYTTTTSPIRRFLDLVIQHQTLNMLRGRGVLFQENELNDFIAAIITAQSRANLVRRLRHRYWLIKYLAKRKGEKMAALIIDKNPKRVNVVILDCLFEADLPPNQGVHAGLGDTVMVQIARANPLDDILRLQW